MAANNNKNSLLASQARELFTEHACRVLPLLSRALGERLLVLVDQPGSAPEMQERRDGWLAFQAGGTAWVNGTAKAWRKAQVQPAVSAAARSLIDSGKFELMGDEVMEDKILSSRLALRLLDFASWELNDLRLRIQSLEGIAELRKGDILRPEVLAEKLVEQWTSANLSRELWVLVQDTIQGRMAEHLLEAYHAANEFLVRQGVMAEIDLRPLVKRTPSAVVAGQPGSAARAADGGVADTGTGAGTGSATGPGGHGGSARGPGSDLGTFGGGRASERARASGFGRSSHGGQAVRAGAESSMGHSSPHDETRMQTATTPLARARMRAQGVMGSLKRLLTNQVAGFDDTRASQESPQLAQAFAGMAAAESSNERTVLAGVGPDQVYGQVHVEQAATALRQRTSNLKKAAATSAEKATIEIVALMFQSILAEDRIPPAIRVWFARLQMPVLRVAISEPEFFGSLQHPARRLIDRMGSCVLGFDAEVSGGAMEAEIRRVVQVIEQYPETGRRVFQLVYDEFQKFLSKFLSENGSAARVVSVAQQVEQKETMAIQYTIEMRNMLNDMPVREEIREFLFKVWAEVLAIAAMRNGPQHEETITLKRAAADLVWAASAKPNRVDRAKVIADLPKLLQLLRLGMSMLGTGTREQDVHIKVISDTLADAFMSKTDAISAEHIEAMAKRLANLEDYLSDEDVGDLPLDTENLVMMIGIDASDLEVITDGGSQPTEAMRAWAQELQLGAWFTLDHNGRTSHVQFAWCSDRKQLHLFASADGRNFLIQARRLAAYLQAGLLVPTEEEALTVRATRDALTKLDANPERLLG
ncbi:MULTISPECIES: DUF1631 family protein [Polaromonas]|uniref:DUF1631 family protein n=1 Tax=Polaromonas aquatica TaxID=332657 RepID=A0ABW1TTL1_9BURK